MRGRLSYIVLTLTGIAHARSSLECTVKAWVRAEDLSPNTIRHGDLRIKINPSCTDPVTAVSLQLQLDEFSQVKYLNENVTLPLPCGCPEPLINTTLTSPTCNDDYWHTYQQAVQDPSSWGLAAEERQVWKTETTLLKGPITIDQPLILPFIVHLPDVNYPPGIDHWTWSLGDSYGRTTASSKHSYHYTAIVEFSSGRTIEIPAGYTTFIPEFVPLKSVEPWPFRTQSTFHESSDCQSRSCSNNDSELQCKANVQATTFGAEVVLDGGNVVRQGETVKGKIAIHRLTPGFTTARSLDLDVMTIRDHHWAKSQATLGGDVAGSPGMTSCSFWDEMDSYTQEILPSGKAYSRMFDGPCSRYGWDRRPSQSIEIPNTSDTDANTTEWYDFEVKVQDGALRTFRTYYATSEAFIQINLGIVHPPEVRRCMYPDLVDEDEDPDEDVEEEGLWEMHTPLGSPRVSSRSLITDSLHAQIPIIIIGPVAHADTRPTDYLAPGVQSPIILPYASASEQRDEDAVVFPISHPLVIRKPIEDTTRRMLGSHDEESPDPTARYGMGPNVGLLWMKKVLKEERDRVGFSHDSDQEVILG